MRAYALSIFFLFSSLCIFSQGPKFDIKFSEPLAIFAYVDQLSSKHPDNIFKKQFGGSIYNRDKYKTLLAQFDTLRINYSYDFEGFPYGSKNPGMTEALLKKNLITSANLKDFKKRAIGIVPNATLLQLTAILYEFQIVYRELVYQPHKGKFEKQVAEITELVKTKNLSTYFDKGLIFYRSNWDESFPFEIAFYPFPGEVGFSAEAFCNNAVCAVTPDTKDYKILLGVLMHEIYHILYNEQSVWVKNNIAKWFAANPSKCSVYGYHLLNEVLATALGNGYVYESLNGKKDEGDWYNRKYIDLMAKKIYPMVADYITQKKPIDEGFVNIYLKFYEENYSDWLNEMNNIMCYRYLITENASDFSVFSKQFPYASLSQYEDQVTELSIQRLKASPVTKIIVVSKDNEVKLALIKKEFPELKEWKYKAKTDFIYTTFLDDKTQFLLINTVKNTTEQMINGRILIPK